MLSQAGLVVTTIADHDRARDHLNNKLYGVALIDLDTPVVDAGLELVRFCRARSPLTSPVVMSGRKSFEVAAQAFRAGASDVVPKTQDVVPYLRDRVVELSAGVRATLDRERMLDEAAELHDRFLTEMRALSRRVTDLEERLANGGRSPDAPAFERVNVLLVDDQTDIQLAIERVLSADRGWRIRTAHSGGEALDAASQLAPHVVLVKEHLSDLPSTMVLRTIRANAPDAVALLFTPPSDAVAGSVKMVDASRVTTLVPAFSSPSQLVDALEEVREALRQKIRERRYLTAFRKEHFDFLKRYNRFRERLAQRKEADATARPPR